MTAVAAAPNANTSDPSFCKGQTDIQTGLMVVTVAAAVLSLIPPFRFIGATVMRSVALVSSLDLCQDSWRQSDWQRRAITCVKVAATALGVVAIVTSSPVLLIAALATDIAVQIFEMLKTPSIGKKLLHLGFLAVNVLVLTGIVLASWEILLAASIVSTVAMLCLGIYIGCKAKTWKDVANMFCYFALLGVGIASGVMVSRLTDSRSYGHTEAVKEIWRGNREYIRRNWVVDGYYEVDIGGKLPVEHYGSLPLGGLAVVAAERTYRDTGTIAT